MRATREQLLRAEWMFRYRAGRWAWIARSPDGDTLAMSKTYFASLLKALSDAQQNGFYCSEETLCDFIQPRAYAHA
jgi:hypothetical protein